MADAFMVYLIISIGIKSIGIIACVIRFFTYNTNDIYARYDMRTYIFIECQGMAMFILLVVFAAEYPYIFCIFECLCQSCIGVLMACSKQVREREANGVDTGSRINEKVENIGRIELRYTYMEEGMRTCLIGIQPDGHIVALVSHA
jgi:hypothetical protein